MSEAAREIVTALRSPTEPPPNPMAAVTVLLRRLIERSSSGGQDAPLTNAAALDSYRRELDALLKGLHGWPALARLCAGLNLTPFERDLLLLCGAVQMNPALLASTAGAVRGHVTFALAFALFGEVAWTGMAPDGLLQRYRLIVAEPDDFLLRAALRIDEVVFAYLLNGAGLGRAGARSGRDRPGSHVSAAAARADRGAHRVALAHRRSDRGCGRRPAVERGPDRTERDRRPCL